MADEWEGFLHDLLELLNDFHSRDVKADVLILMGERLGKASSPDRPVIKVRQHHDQSYTL